MEQALWRYKYGMLYSENAKIIYMRLTISETDMKDRKFDRNILVLVRKPGLVYFLVDTNSKDALWGHL